MEKYSWDTERDKVFGGGDGGIRGKGKEKRKCENLVVFDR